MNIITTTALSNFRKNKSRNILIGIAIGLTALLLTVVPTIVMANIEARNQTVNQLYPTFHGMYRDVDAETLERLKKEENLTQIGVREDPAEMYCDDPDVAITMVSVDKTVRTLNKMKLKEGTYPKNSDEIIVSEGLLKEMGISGAIGDRIRIPFQPVTKKGKEKAQEKEFTIVGMTANTKENEENKVYSAVVSETFGKEILPEEERSFRVYFRIANAKGMVTDKIEEKIGMIGETYGISQGDIVINEEYLTANYVDAALYAGVTVILLIVALVGILTIYSIYYVSMLDKVQEYGKLRAIGATKRQIRKLVFREGFSVALIAIPIGIVLGLFAGTLIFRGMIAAGMDADNFIAQEMKKLIESGSVSMINGWIIAFSALISLVTVYVSLLRPMRIASKISAIEAIRYQGQDKTKKKDRKGYEEINIKRLAISNLGRNKKRTVITVFTLSATGILFMIVATICNCMSAKSLTERDIRGDISIILNYSIEDKMHPEWEISYLQTHNPLSDELRSQIEAVDGVERMEETLYVSATSKEFVESDGELMNVGIDGLSPEAMKDLEKYVEEGSLDSEALKTGRGLIIGNAALYIKPDIQVGDKVSLSIADGTNTIEKEFEISAIVDAPISLTGYAFSVPQKVLEDMCSADVLYGWNIWAEDGKEEAAAEAIAPLIEDNPMIAMSTYLNIYEGMKKTISLTTYMGYGMLAVFGLIGILNLINTMINSVHVRKKELGMIQAIGMSGRQTVNMLQLEGMFYTVSTLVLSLGVGGAAGYGVFLWAKSQKFMEVSMYHYPALQALVLILTIAAVQILVTYAVNHNFKKQSLIERIRFSE